MKIAHIKIEKLKDNRYSLKSETNGKWTEATTTDEDDLFETIGRFTLQSMKQDKTEVTIVWNK